MGMIEELFGASPADIQRQRMQEQEVAAQRFGAGDPFAQVRAGWHQFGSRLGDALGGMMGGVDPRVAEAQQRQQALQGLDLSNSQSILAKAQQVQDPVLSMKLKVLAQQRMAEERKAQIESQKQALAERRQEFQEGEAMDLRKEQMRGNIDAKMRGLELQELQIKGMLEQRGLDRESRERLAAADNAIKAQMMELRMAMQQMGLQAKADEKAQKIQSKQEEATKKAQEQALTADTQLEAIERNLNKVLTPEGKATGALKSYTGQMDQFWPDYLTFSSTASAGSALKSLQEQMTMMNLAESKKAVGQSFGSMQVKEWDKFLNLLTNLSRGTPDKEIEDNLKFVRDYIRDKRNVIKVGIAGGKFGADQLAKEATSPATYDADKEARYQAWKARQGK